MCVMNALTARQWWLCAIVQLAAIFADEIVAMPSPRATMAAALSPVYPRAPFRDCGSKGFNITAVYFEQLNKFEMINGFDATATREFLNATFTVEVNYAGQKPMSHSFGVCAAGRLHMDGFPTCPWQPGTPLHIIDHNPAFYRGPEEYQSTWKMIDSENSVLFCMQTNWTLHP